jgi:hypothetical protein
MSVILFGGRPGSSESSNVSSSWSEFTFSTVTVETGDTHRCHPQSRYFPFMVDLSSHFPAIHTGFSWLSSHVRLPSPRDSKGQAERRHLGGEARIKHSGNHTEIICLTVWLFNVAMENHHFWWVNHVNICKSWSILYKWTIFHIYFK